MKLTVASSDLNKAMRRLAAIVERRNTIPVLANVRLEVRGDELRLTTTDLDIEATTSLTIEDSAAGDITVPAHLLADIVAKLPAGAVSLAMGDAARLILRSGRSRFTLATLPAIDFPDIAAGDLGPAFSLPAADALALFDWPGFAVSTEETRYYLNGIYLHVLDDRLVAVATDGHRLAKATIAAPDHSHHLPGIIVPRKTLSTIVKLAGEGDLIVSASSAKIRVECPAAGTTVVSKLIDGTFPDYGRAIPRHDRHVPLDREALLATVDRVSTISSERGRAIRLSLGQGGPLTIAVKNPDAGEATEEMDCGDDGPAFQIGFNARYLADILGKFDTAKVRFAIRAPGDPAMITAEPPGDRLTVLMPMRI